MNFTHFLLDEPQLEFGDGGRHIDPRFGLCRYGPLQTFAGDHLTVGLIGTAETVEGFERWMTRITRGIAGSSTKQPNLFPPFPGLRDQNPFRCSFEVSPTARRVLPLRQIGQIISTKGHSEAVGKAASLLSEQASAMLESSDKPDVIVVALPFDLIERVVNDHVQTADENRDYYDSTDLDFRDLFKAQTLRLRRPTQVVWPTLWDDDARIPRKLKDTTRRVQDPATRAWNLSNALFYKAGRVPWRLPRSESQLQTSYVGIGFYRDLSGKRLLTSTAQMFDERGKGVILRGARAHVDRSDRHPYLDRVDAYDLLRRSLKRYFDQHYHFPARLVILKTSRFERGEAQGFQEAAEEASVAYSDLVWINERSAITMYREGDYPPLRGTVIVVGRDAVVFTRGSVPLYRTYPGLRVPRPLMLRPYNNDRPIGEIARDVLALTKMNWNSTQFDGAIPIPIRAARQVGKVLRHVPHGETEASDYPYYM